MKELGTDAKDKTVFGAEDKINPIMQVTSKNELILFQRCSIGW